MKKIILALILVLVSTSVFASDRRIRIHNNTSKRIVELYGSPIDDAKYRYNMINGPSEWIRAGGTRVADIDDGSGYCRYDLMVIMANGDRAEKLNVNVCELTDWYIYD